MKFHILKTRIAYDYFCIEAETVKEAANLVNRGKIREQLIDTTPTHDTHYDQPDEVIVYNPDKQDEFGHDVTIYRSSEC